MATLLEKALAVPVGRKNDNFISESLDEQLEMALAYCAGRVTERQFGTALGIPKHSSPAKVGTILRQAVRAGLLVRAPKE